LNITLTNISKRYNYEWIFRKVNYEFTFDNNYVIIGANGSGKSTLLQVIASSMIPSEGEIKYSLSSNKVISVDNMFQHLSFASPYLELFDEFTLIESIEFQGKFKKYINNISAKTIVEIAELEKAKNKQIKYYSSGMKQRVRLLLAVLADTPILLLDEPASNLDKKSVEWYQQLIKNYGDNRLIIVASNQQEQEYGFCNKVLNIEDYK
jgi:ABC-type multidrug transport system ATPase subunit